MLARLSASTVVAVVAGYLFSDGFNRTVDFVGPLDYMPHPIIAAESALLAVAAVLLGVALLVGWRRALSLTKLYLWFEILASALVLCFVLFGLLEPDLYFCVRVFLKAALSFALILLLRRPDVQTGFMEESPQEDLTNR